MSTPEETYRRGSVVLRGDQIPRLTADASLLQTEQSADWKHTDPWRVLRIQSEFVEGFEALAKVGPAISVFGSARTRPRRPPLPSVRGASASCWSSAATRSSRAAARA